MGINELYASIYYELIYEDQDFITFAYSVDEGPIYIITRLKRSRDC